MYKRFGMQEKQFEGKINWQNEHSLKEHERKRIPLLVATGYGKRAFIFGNRDHKMMWDYFW